MNAFTFFTHSFFIVVLSIFSYHGAHANACTASEPQVVQAILHEVNLDRLQHGRLPLRLREDMCQEALRHSRDMATHRIPFGHTGFSERLKHIYAHTHQPRGASENVAYHYRDGRDVVRNWLTSPHHRANIRGHYNYTGIGVTRDRQGNLYFTQLFLLG